MVDVTKPIVNPRLSEALAALHRENTPANQDRALRELMTQAHLLAPVVLTPAPPPAVSGQTTLEQNTAIQFQLISSQEGRPFFPAFTNWGSCGSCAAPGTSRPWSSPSTTMPLCSSGTAGPPALWSIPSGTASPWTGRRWPAWPCRRQRALHRSGR